MEKALFQCSMPTWNLEALDPGKMFFQYPLALATAAVPSGTVHSTVHVAAFQLASVPLCGICVFPPAILAYVYPPVIT